MALARALGRIARLAALTVRSAPAHLLARRKGHSPWPQRFLAAAAGRAGFDVHVEGTPLTEDVFLVANHSSWVDILALGGATGCAFISKDDVEGAPIVGWLAAQNNTIFVSRDRRGAVSGQIETLRAALERHQPIALFPEGTTGDGVTLLPFKPALFSVLLPPPRAIRIQPVMIDYGAAATFVPWLDGESGIANALRILGAPGRRAVTLRFLEPFDPGDHPDRKAIAAETRARIAATLAARQSPSNASIA